MITWTVQHGRIPEQVTPGRRLGRHFRHDSRSLRYAWRRTPAPVQSVTWTRRIPILDQGDVGSCTGNAAVGALGTDPLYASVPHGPLILNEDEAVSLYSAAEVLDGDGPYPPNDNGSSGLSVCQAARQAGLISGYLNCYSVADILDALQHGPVIAGSNWYDSMDFPDGDGVVTIRKDAQVRGGHEYLVRGVDAERHLIACDNSWGPAWGRQGSFFLSWQTAERLLNEQGDVMSLVPLGQPPPVPAGGP